MIVDGHDADVDAIREAHRARVIRRPDRRAQTVASRVDAADRVGRSIDAHDRERPRLNRIYDVDGNTFNSRIVGNDLYLVQNGSLQVPPKLMQEAQKVMAKIPRADQSSLRPWEVQSRLAAT